MILKHVRNWSYYVLEREVRANLVYRDFTRVGAAKMPDAKTMGRWGRALGPQVIKRVHEQIVVIARTKEVIEGRRMRVDTTVTETIHHPTDSSLLGDGVRVLTRTMKKITKIAGEVGTKLRNRSRSVKLRVNTIFAPESSYGFVLPLQRRARQEHRSSDPLQHDRKNARGIAQLIRMGWFGRCVLDKLRDVELSLRGFGLKLDKVTQRGS
jgi:hypothetical protein